MYTHTHTHRLNIKPWSQTLLRTKAPVPTNCLPHLGWGALSLTAKGFHAGLFSRNMRSDGAQSGGRGCVCRKFTWIMHKTGPDFCCNRAGGEAPSAGGISPSGLRL